MDGRKLELQLQEAKADIIKRVRELQESKYWVENGSHPCLKHKMEIGQRVASKGTHVCSFSIEKVIDFLRRDDSLGKLNHQLMELKILYEKDVTKILYMQYKGVWPVSNRDFVNIAVAHKVSEEKIYIGTKAFNYPYPEVNGVVRGQVFIGAYILEKVDENKTRVVYISDADLKGWIPNFLKNALSELQGNIAFEIENIMKKENY